MKKYPFNYRCPRNIGAKRKALSKEDIEDIQENYGSFNIKHKENLIPNDYDDLLCSRCNTKSWKEKSKKRKQYRRKNGRQK